MHEKISKLIVAVSVIFVVIIVISVIRTISGEDDWVCVNGSWVKHGNPTMPMPQEECK